MSAARYAHGLSLRRAAVEQALAGARALLEDQEHPSPQAALDLLADHADAELAHVDPERVDAHLVALAAARTYASWLADLAELLGTASPDEAPREAARVLGRTCPCCGCSSGCSS